MAPKTIKQTIDDFLNAIGITKSYTKDEAEALEKLIENAPDIQENLEKLTTSQKLRLAQAEKRMQVLQDTEKTQQMLLDLERQRNAAIDAGNVSLQKTLEDRKKEIEMARDYVAGLDDFNGEQYQRRRELLQSMSEEIGLGNTRISQLKAVTKLYEKAAKEFPKAKPAGVERADIADIALRMGEAIQGAGIENLVNLVARENVAFQELFGVTGTLLTDYAAGIDAFTNGLDTGFRSVIRSGTRFTPELKEIFTSSIDPIQSFAGEAGAISRTAAANLGGMLKNVAFNGETASAALMALKNNTSFLRQSFIAANKENEVAAAHFANLTQGLAKLGVAEDDTAVSLDFFVKGLKQTPKEASESIRALENMAHSLDVNVGQAFSEFVSLQGSLAQFGGDINRVFGDLKAQAVATGVSVSDLNSVAERLDTFQGAAQAAQGFNAVLGQTVVSVTDLVHAEPAEKIQILKDALDRSGISFDSANRRIKSMIAGFLGVDRAQAAKIFGSDDDFFSLRENIDGSASSMEDLDTRIRSSMTNAEKMTETLSSIGKASTQAIERARQNATDASKSMLAIISDLGKSAEEPLEVLAGLRLALAPAGVVEGGVQRATALGRNIVAVTAVAQMLIDSLGSVGKGRVTIALKALEKATGLDVVEFDRAGNPRIKARKMGGDLGPGDLSLVGEGGPELIQRKRSDPAATVIPNQMLAGAGQNVEVHITSPITLTDSNGNILTVANFDSSFKGKFEKAAFGKPNPTYIG